MCVRNSSLSNHYQVLRKSPCVFLRVSVVKRLIMPVSRIESKPDVAEAQLEYQQELEQLQRQYRKMKCEKNNHKVESQNVLKRQECEIEQLQNEHREIEMLLKATLCRINVDFDKGNEEKLNELLVKDGDVNELLEEGKLAIASLDKRIATSKEELFNKKTKMDSSCQSSLPFGQFSIQRQIRILENRVYHANVKYSRQLTKNAKLKATIDYILYQKKRFRELHRRLKKVYKDVKQEIDSVVESSLSYFHVCDEAQHRMAIMREKAERDLALYNMELKVGGAGGTMMRMSLTAVTRLRFRLHVAIAD